jgi:FkbM family methyltransferase
VPSLVSSELAVTVRSAIRRRPHIQHAMVRMLSLRRSGEEHEESFRLAMFACIRPGDCVWDVGANVGYYSELFASAVGPSGKVISFEPSAECAAVLQERARDRSAGASWEIEPLALSDADGDSWLSMRAGVTAPGNQTVSGDGPGAIAVQTARGDSLLANGYPAPAVVKIDVEGFEGEVLDGMGSVLHLHSLRAVCIEVHFRKLNERGRPREPARIVQLLRSSGFSVKWIDKSHLVAQRSSAADKGGWVGGMTFGARFSAVVSFVWTHPANRDARIRALLRLARFQFRSRVLHQRTLARLGAQSRIWAYPFRHAASKVVYANPPDHPEMLVWQRVLRSGDLFVDVGANIGSYTILAGELGAEVIAFEPASDTFALLAENVALNGYPVQAIQAAAGSACGTARFTNGRDCVNRMDTEGDVETAVVTVDSVINDRTVAGMKVDVEGFEIDVLRGCERALSEGRIRLIQLEWNSTSLSATGCDRGPAAELLAKFGYRLYRPDDLGNLVAIKDPSPGSDVFAAIGPLCAR